MHSLAGRTIISAHTSTSEIFIFIKTSICINSNDKFIVPTSDTSIPQYAKIQKPRYMLFVFNILSFCKISNSSNDGGSNLVWHGLRFGKNYREYCNKQALICNKLRTVSKIGGDTGTFRKIWATEQLYTVWVWMIASRTLHLAVFEGKLWGRKQKSQSVWLA